MTVSVDIEVARRAAALLVPIGAVRDADGSTPWVLRVEAGRAVRRTVRLGLRAGGYGELLEGLQAGDSLVPLASDLVEGRRVRILGHPAAVASTSR